MRRLFFILLIFSIMIQYPNPIHAEEMIDIIDIIELEDTDTGDDFYVYIDSEQLTGVVRWEELQSRRGDAEYLLIVEADGNTQEPILKETTREDLALFFYPQEIETLSIALYVKSEDQFTLLKRKNIDLMHGEFLKRAVEGETLSSRLKLSYYSINENILEVILNEKLYTYLIQGQDSISIALESGSNQYEASFEGEDRVIYRVSGNIYYNTLPPSIDINEDLYGKIYTADQVTITGSVENGSELTINGQGVQLDENGEFIHTIFLEDGKNKITFFAKSDAGVTSFRSVVIEKEIEKDASSIEKNIDWLLFMLIGVSAVVLALILIFFIKKRVQS